MAQYIQQFACTIPAGTAQASPATVSLAIDYFDLEMIGLEVPAGPAGLMGFYVSNNGVQWIPSTVGSWLVWDDVHKEWPLSDQPNASGWAVVGYNLDVFNHTVTVRMHYNKPAAAATSSTVPQLVVMTTPGPQPDPVVL